MFDLGIRDILETTKDQATESAPVKDYTDEVTWLKCAKMRNAELIVDVHAKRIKAIIVHDRVIQNAVDTLKQAKHFIGKYGATEGLMALFNAGDQLSNCIGMTIPQITEANAKVVGEACCENIDAAVIEAYAKVKQFFNDICDAANAFFNKLKDQAVCQKATIESLVKDILGHTAEVDQQLFANGGIYGYSQSAFMQRIGALQFINDNLPNVDCTTDAQKQFEPYLKVLGYKLVEKANEDLEAPAQTEIESAPPQEEAKEVTMEVAQWTPESVTAAAKATIELLGSVGKLVTVSTKLAEVRNQVIEAIDSIATADEAAQASKKQTIDCGRAYAAFVGDIVTIYGSAINELVDQVVCMSGKIVEALPKNQPASEPAPASVDPAPAEPAPAPAPEATSETAPVSDSMKNQDPPAGGAPQEGQPEGGQEGQPAEGEQPQGQGGEQPADGGEQKNKVEKPEGVPQAKPVQVPGVCPDGEPHPGDAPHVTTVETPESEQPNKPAEKLLEDTDNTRLW